MGTHPIFESDFDCLTDLIFRINQSNQVFSHVTYERNENDSSSWETETDSVGDFHYDESSRVT